MPAVSIRLVLRCDRRASCHRVICAGDGDNVLAALVPPRAFVLGTQSEKRCSIDLRNLLAWTSVWTAALGLETCFAGFLIAT
ncbi:unnamed protein product [Mycetohabitans rhizoxinica HKI 454]|uniref:Uncharacterized protein n=1 Tax=Mycetohabitans rhizoxinica (strain DSM 19002 / CIP 109453 / HKI 454) TaxID=882378 RepID=E5AS61_MYCRK|nr:unnamed protein product [Mycetohabitans rhizoxinica HKI 454]